MGQASCLQVHLNSGVDGGLQLHIHLSIHIVSFDVSRERGLNTTASRTWSDPPSMALVAAHQPQSRTASLPAPCTRVLLAVYRCAPSPRLSTSPDHHLLWILVLYVWLCL